jgi:hypothetical protein
MWGRGQGQGHQEARAGAGATGCMRSTATEPWHAIAFVASHARPQLASVPPTIGPTSKAWAQGARVGWGSG